MTYWYKLVYIVKFPRWLRTNLPRYLINFIPVYSLPGAASGCGRRMDMCSGRLRISGIQEGQSIVVGAASQNAMRIIVFESSRDSSTMDRHRHLLPPHDWNCRQRPGSWWIPLSASSGASNGLERWMIPAMWTDVIQKLWLVSAP
jgi:hypothetical protein